jgi:hypothetical protein
MTTSRVAATLAILTILGLGRARADEPVQPPAPAPAPAPAQPATAPEPAHPTDNSLTFAGSLQLDYLGVPTERSPRAFTLDGATVELSLKLTKDFSKNASASVKVCFACHGFEAGLAVVELRAADELRMRAGRMTPAFGGFPQRHDPAHHMTSDNRSLRHGRCAKLDWNEGILPAPWWTTHRVAGTHFSKPPARLRDLRDQRPKAGEQATDFHLCNPARPRESIRQQHRATGARLRGCSSSRPTR